MTVDPVKQFQTDFDQLNADASAWNDAVKAQQAAIKQYLQEFEALNGQAGKMNPLVLMMMFIYMIGNAGFNELDQSTSVGGSVLAIQGDLDKCTNDINQMTDQTDNKTTGQGSLLDITAQSMSKMLDLLGANPSQEGTFIQGAIGPDAAKSIFGSMDAVRGDIYDKYDPDGNAYNPTPVNPPPGQGPRTYHFDVDAPLSPTDPNSSYIGNFFDLNSYMSQAGDPAQATQAAQLKTQNFSAFTNTMNSGQTATQQSLSQDSKTTQTIQSFLSNMAHSLMSVISVAMQNLAKAAS